MNYLHDNELNNIVVCNLLNDIINPSKSKIYINIRYSHILHGYINTRKGKYKFRGFCILLDSGCISTIFIRRLIKKLKTE